MAGISEGNGKALKKYLRQIIEGERKEYLSAVLGFFLYFLSLIYSGILILRLFFYRWGIIKVSRHDIKVISVGNITVGGTGKTPLVEKIVEYLQSEKRRAAIISRGYKGIQSKHGFFADEPQMLKTRFPEVQVIINKDRNAALKLAQDEMNCEIAVLDDAYQNLKTGKDLDIVCIDCLNPFGYGYVLPRGLLRMPLYYLNNAQVFMLTHTDEALEKAEEIINKLRKYNQKAQIFKSSHVPEFLYNIVDGQRMQLTSIRGKKIALLCAIARPLNFAKTLKGLGAKIEENFYFEDHYAFTDEELQSVFARCLKSNIKLIITTAKDEPRIKAVLRDKHPEAEILVLKIKLEVENERRFFEIISALFAD